TLVDRKSSVDLILVSREADQHVQHRRGTRRLVALSSPSPESYVHDHLSNDEKLLLTAGPYRTVSDAIADMTLYVADRVIQRHAPDGFVWSRDVFDAICREYASTLIDELYAAVELVVKILRAAREA